MRTSITMEPPASDPGGAPELSEAVRRGQAIYTPLMLRTYDVWVLGLSNLLLWRCPTSRLLAHYARHLTDNHVEVGVGTAYLLAHSRFRSASPRITLIDLNPNTLAFGARRLRRFAPRTRRANVLKPIPFEESYTSAAMNYVLHCLPGPMHEKAAALDHVKRGLAPGGCLFGSTLLGRGIAMSKPAQRLMSLYNRKGIFSNRHDDLESLDTALRQRFSRHEIELIGCAAIFVGYC